MKIPTAFVPPLRALLSSGGMARYGAIPLGKRKAFHEAILDEIS